jgi:hypothetical protein
MRTITATWSIPEQEQDERGSWLSNIGASLRRIRSARMTHGQARKVASSRGSHDPFVQADAAAFVSAFMRIG